MQEHPNFALTVLPSVSPHVQVLAVLNQGLLLKENVVTTRWIVHFVYEFVVRIVSVLLLVFASLTPGHWS